MDPKTAKRLDFLINTAYFAVIIGLAYFCMRYVAGWILPFLLAFLIVTMVRPVIRKIKKLLHIEREFISLIIMLLIYILLCGLLAFLGTQLAYWTRDFLGNIPDFYENSLRPSIEAGGRYLSGILADLPEPMQAQFYNFQDDLLGTLQGLLLGVSQRGLSALSSFTARVPTFIVALIFTVMLSFFISMQYEKVVAFFYRVLPDKAEGWLRDLKTIMRQTGVQYLRAQFTLMLITATELSVGLLLLGQSNAIGIAVGIAVFDALPVFGTGAIMIPWTILELLQGNFTFGVGLGILYGIVTLIRNIIEPKIVSDKLGINPIVSLVSIYFGFRTWGVLGMIFMPILVQILFAMYAAGNLPIFYRIFGDKPQPPEPAPEKDKKG